MPTSNRLWRHRDSRSANYYYEHRHYTATSDVYILYIYIYCNRRRRWQTTHNLLLVTNPRVYSIIISTYLICKDPRQPIGVSPSGNIRLLNNDISIYYSRGLLQAKELYLPLRGFAAVMGFRISGADLANHDKTLDVLKFKLDYYCLGEFIVNFDKLTQPCH